MMMACASLNLSSCVGFLFFCFIITGSLTPADALPIKDNGVSGERETKRHKIFVNGTDWEIIPSPGLQNRLFNISMAKRRLGEFQLCALCTCCGGLRRLCLPTGCCYSITCGSPDKPFGLCSFTPIACNCFDCHL